MVECIGLTIWRRFFTKIPRQANGFTCIVAKLYLKHTTGWSTSSHQLLLIVVKLDADSRRWGVLVSLLTDWALENENIIYYIFILGFPKSPQGWQLYLMTYQTLNITPAISISISILLQFAWNLFSIYEGFLFVVVFQPVRPILQPPLQSTPSFLPSRISLFLHRLLHPLASYHYLVILLREKTYEYYMIIILRKSLIIFFFCENKP